MSKASIFSPEHKKFLQEVYLRQCINPATCATMLNAKFGTTFAHTQVQRWINANLTKKRKAVSMVLAPMERKTNVQIARQIANRHKVTMERWVESSERAADKAFVMVDNARDARTLSAAASAASTLIKNYRICAGIDGNDTPSRGAATFNFNFASEQPRKVDEAVDVAAETST